MAADIRLADRGATQTSLPIVIDGLTYHASEYTQLLIICTNGERKYATGGGGSAHTSFYTNPVDFTGLTPGHTYGFRVEAIWRAGTRMVPIPENGTLRYFTTLQPDVNQPGIPTVSLLSVSGRTITWRVRAGAYTHQVAIDKSWGGNEEYFWVSSNNTMEFSHTFPENGATYGIRAKGWNDGAMVSAYSGWSYGTTQSITVGGVGTVVTSNVGINGFRLSWSAANNASSYQVQYREEGTSSWSSRYTSALYYDVTGLPEGVYYQFRVRGYQGDVFGSYSSIGRVRTDKTAPTDLNWPTFIAGAPVDALTAKRWNDLLSKINAWREYHGHPIGTFTTVFTGDIIRAALYNQAVTNISVLPVTTTLPQAVSVGTIITTDRLNRLGVAIDSL